ncbi:MAG: phosphoribosyltransferase family protein, partial [Chloroflexota bacterium]|nr:phosphoribosyltransferase family protein [Chloroflexota bacterium]
MSELQVIYSEQCIKSAIERVAGEIRLDYQNKNPLLIGVLKGVFVFMADLVRALNIPLEVEFVRLSSYGYGRTESSGDVKVIHGLESVIEGRHVLVVEDIVDEGRTLNHLLKYLHEQK